MKTPLLITLGSTVGLFGFALSTVDRIACAPAVGESLILSTELEFRSDFEDASITIQGNEMPPEAVIQDYDESAMSGERVLTSNLRVVPGEGGERSIWLSLMEIDGEESEAAGELEIGQGVRFSRGGDSWSGAAIDEEGESLDVDAEGALSAEALFEALLPEDDVELEGTWDVELDPETAAGLILPGLGFATVVELMPDSPEDGEDDSMGRLLHAQLPEILAAMDGDLKVECQLTKLDEGRAVIQYKGEWSVALDLSEPFSEAIQVGGSADEAAPAETTAEAAIEFELAGTLVWDLEPARPVEHSLAGDWTTDLLVEAVASMDGGEIPITAEFTWSGTILSETSLE